MSLIQNEPRYDISTNLSATILSQVSAIKTVVRGWPDKIWFSVDNNLPGVAILDVSSKPGRAVAQASVVHHIRHPDGTGQIVYEKARPFILIQMSVFANTKADRDNLGWAIEQYLTVNYHLPIIDYTKMPPMRATSGEHILIELRGDHTDLPGGGKFWRRDMTWEIQTRVLDAQQAWAVQQIDATVTNSPHAALPLPVVKTPVVIVSTQLSNGSFVDTLTIT